MPYHVLRGRGRPLLLHLFWALFGTSIGTLACSAGGDGAPAAPSTSATGGAGGSTSSAGGSGPTTAGSGGSTEQEASTTPTGTGGSGEPEGGVIPPPADDARADTGSEPLDAGAERAAPPSVQDAGDGAAPPRTTYDPNDFLKVSGTQIKNGRGQVVSMYGTNLGGWLVHEAWMSPIAGVPDDSHMFSTLTQRFGAAGAKALVDAYQSAWLEPADFAKIAAEGLNVVRIPIDYLDMMDATGNWKLDAQGKIDFSRLDWAVEQAARNGIYSLIDLHGVPGSQNGWEHSGLVTSTPTFFRDTAAQAVALKFWTETAKHYVGNSFVAAYDLLNEPNAATGETLWGFYDKAIAAVRAVDPDHIVILETPWQWSGLPNPATRKWTNVIYSNHNYQWMNNNDINVMRGFVDGIMSDATSHFPTYGIPVIIGEFTLFGLLDAWTYGLGRFAEQGGINWTMWSYKVRTTNSTWGLYNLTDGENSDTNVPNIATDSQATILAKWSWWKTSLHFQRNNSLCDIVKGAANKNMNLRRPVFTP